MLLRRIRPLLLAPALVLALAGTGFGAMATPASASARTSGHVFALAHGTFVGQPLTVTSVVPDGAIYRIEGFSGDHWDGTLTGDTSYSGSGTFDPATGAVAMVLHETFTGTVAGVGSGQIQFVEYLQQSGPGNATVDCLVTSATGDLAGLHGYVHFRQTGVIDPDPTGNGTSVGDYIGALFR